MVLKQLNIMAAVGGCFRSMSSQMVLKLIVETCKDYIGFRSMSSQMVLKLPFPD